MAVFLPNQQSKAIFIVIAIFFLLMALSSYFDPSPTDLDDDDYYYHSASPTNNHHQKSSSSLLTSSSNQQLSYDFWRQSLPLHAQKLLVSQSESDHDAKSCISSPSILMHHHHHHHSSTMDHSSISINTTTTTSPIVDEDHDDATKQKYMEDSKFYSTNFHKTMTSKNNNKLSRSWYFTHIVQHDSNKKQQQEESVKKMMMTTRVFLTVVSPRVIMVGSNNTTLSKGKSTGTTCLIQQFEAILSSESRHEWKLVQEHELMVGRVVFAQQDVSSPNCVIVSFETEEDDGLNVKSHLKSYCVVEHEHDDDDDDDSKKDQLREVTSRTYDWPVKGSRSVMSVGNSIYHNNCAYLSLVNDRYAFRYVCRDNQEEANHPHQQLSSNVDLILGNDDSKMIHQVISAQEMSNQFIFTWELVSDVDSIRNSDREDYEEDGIDLYLRIYYVTSSADSSKNHEETRNVHWKSSTYGRVKRVMSNIVRHTGNSLNDIYFYGKRPTYQSGDAKTAVFCSETGELVIAKIRPEIQGPIEIPENMFDSDIRKFISVKTFDFSKYVTQQNISPSNDMSLQMRSSYYSRMYTHDHSSSIERLVSELLQKQKQQLLQLNRYSMPSKIVINHQGNLIALVMQNLDSIYVISQAGDLWTVHQIIHRFITPNATSLDVKTKSDADGFLSRLLSSQTTSTTPKTLLRVIDAQFIGESSKLLVLYEDSSVSIYSIRQVTTQPKSKLSNETEEELDEWGYSFSENWQLYLLVGFIVAYFIMNEITIRRRIRIRRQQVTEQRQQQRDRMQQQEQQSQT